MNYCFFSLFPFYSYFFLVKCTISTSKLVYILHDPTQPISHTALLCIISISFFIDVCHFVMEVMLGTSGKVWLYVKSLMHYHSPHLKIKSRISYCFILGWVMNDRNKFQLFLPLKNISGTGNLFINIS